MAPHENGSVAQHITEDEAALYDRQIRLWGLEAQQRMRNATILVINLRGVATEVIKNIVLSGIGKLVVLDTAEVLEEDLGAGFFFRDTDVGKKRVDAAKSRIQSLNPLVNVQTISNHGPPEWWETTVELVDVVCLTDGSREELSRISELCRKRKKPFYTGGTYGLTGYIFCDLLIHEYLSPDRTIGSDEQSKSIKHTVEYPSFSDALKHDWRNLTKKQSKHQNVELVLSIFALWAYQLQRNTLPIDAGSASDLDSIAKSLITSAKIHSHVLSSIPMDNLSVLASTAAHEFSPVCAVVGGLMGQDVLKALGGRDPPIANFFVFDGKTGSGAVSRLNMPN